MVRTNDKNNYMTVKYDCHNSVANYLRDSYCSPKLLFSAEKTSVGDSSRAQ